MSNEWETVQPIGPRVGPTSWLRRLDIRHKLVAIVMVVCVFVLTLTGLVIVSYQHVENRRLLVRELQSEAGVIGHSCRALLLSGDRSEAKALLGVLAFEPAVAFAYILDARGRLFAEYNRSGMPFTSTASRVSAEEGYLFAGGRLRVTRQVTEGEKVLGSVSVWSDLGSVHAATRRNIAIYLGAMILASLAGYLLSRPLRNQIADPLMALTDTARRVSEEQRYSVRVQPVGDDEIGALTQAFNTMLQHIQARDSALVCANRQLESRVQDRTTRLTEANEKLKIEVGHRNRAEQRLRERTERIITHQAVLLRLNQMPDSDMPTFYQETTKALMQSLGVGRVSYWAMNNAGDTLHRESLTLREGDTETEGAFLSLREYPEYGAALATSRIVVAEDVASNLVTRKLFQGYLQSFDVRSTMDIPIRLHGRLAGVIRHEHVGQKRSWTVEEQDFAGSVADLIMLKLERLKRFQTQRALRDSEHRYRTLLQNIPHKVFYKDCKSRYLLCNESYAQDLGLVDPSEIEGKTDFDFHPAALSSRYVAADQRILATGRAEDLEEVYVLNGRSYTVQSLISPVWGEEGAIVGIFGIFWDITRRKEVERALEELNEDLRDTVEELQRSNGELQDFAYVMAHDLKAPLRAIGMLTDWVYSDCHKQLDDQGCKHIQMIKGRAARMSDLIDHVLRYFEIGRDDRVMQRVNLDTLAWEVTEAIQPPSHIKVTFDTPLPVVMGEPMRLREVFQSLIENAIRFMDKSEGCITIGCSKAEDVWQLYVSDNGPGIEEKYFDRIFRIFQTLAPRDELESTGIGLAMVKKIVEIHGGTIWIESKKGQGSCFVFTLPRNRRAEDAERREGCIRMGATARDGRPSGDPAEGATSEKV